MLMEALFVVESTHLCVYRLNITIGIESIKINSKTLSNRLLKSIIFAFYYTIIPAFLKIKILRPMYSGKYELCPVVKKLYQLRPEVTASSVSVASRGDRFRCISCVPRSRNCISCVPRSRICISCVPGCQPQA
jgi:hypothetical protein